MSKQKTKPTKKPSNLSELVGFFYLHKLFIQEQDKMGSSDCEQQST